MGNAPAKTGQIAVGRPKRMPLGEERALVCDVTYFARRLPIFPVEKVFDLGEVAALREAAQPRISWSVLFLKAYGLVASRHVSLRRAYVRWPWPHFVEWPHSIGTLAISRETAGDKRLCWARFVRPEERTLTELNERLRWFQERPIDEAFKQQVQLSKLPRMIRQLIWWWNLEFAGGKRATRLGTFSLSSLAGQGVVNRGHPTVLTSSLTYGPLDERDRSVVTLLCDHRVLDGAPAAAALHDLETVLQTEICRELRSLSRRKAA
jgi:hypothetical protein